MHFIQRIKSLSAIIITILLITSLSASDWKLNPGMFNPSGVPSLPFSQPRFADMDADGDLDMILGSTADKPMFLTNTGTSTSPKFTFIDDIFSSVNGLDAEMGVCYDIDADGDLDLISGGFTGLQLYRNTGNVLNAEFSKIDNFFSGLTLGSNPIPDLGDIDNDGDLDLLVGFSESGLIKLYTNSGSDSSAIFLESSALTIADAGLYAYPVFCDPDNDGDLDILSGRDGYNFYYYKNTGSITSGSWSSNSSVFYGLGGDTYFNSPAMADINGDGKQDLIYGTYVGPLNYYRNSGTSTSPSWTENTSLFGGVIDIGSASTPYFVDKDRDGDMDMVTGTQMGDIKLYRNDGSPSAPAFTYATTYTPLKHSLYSFVSFAEVTGDASYDALVGDFNGNIYFHEGSGYSFVPASSAMTIDNVGGWSAPRFIDLDNDGDQDIVAGNEDGYLIYYENQGTASQPMWSIIYNYFDSLDVGSSCVPAFADLDFDGDYDLITGDLFREIQYFENQNGVWVEDTSMVEGIEAGQNASPAFADLDGDGDQDLILGNYSGNFDYYENLREVVAIKPVTTLPNDFKLNSYPNPFNPSTAISFSIFATNFAKASLVRKASMDRELHVELMIFDLNGKLINTLLNEYKSAGKYSLNFIAPATMSTGIYFCRLSIDGKIADTKKITLLK
ncbi:MAG: T9SS type A sorting domain-containing protein [Candidatus Marinimicrobia bacterium]|nr:T9SS type A sorting domain-containing protein [Candidatus Neomarinimicrobiota bacterium]